MKVFVYNEFLKDFNNHHILESINAKFVTCAYIRDKDVYFVSLGSFPAVVDGKGIVFGEIYEIPDDKINVIDKFEGYKPNRINNNNLYVRKRIVAVTPKGQKIWVSYYHWTGLVDKHLHIKKGNWAKVVKRYRSY